MTKNIIVYTAESEGKIRDTTFFNEKNVLALEWCKEHKGENTNIGIMQCKLPTSLDKKEKPISEDIKKITERTHWNIQIKCIEKNTHYNSVQRCAKELKLSAYKIRRAIDTPKDVEGLHFIREMI